MPFIEPITIKDAIENIYRKNYLLPAIQRINADWQFRCAPLPAAFAEH